MNFKKTLSLVLAVIMVITVVPFSGFATDGATCDHNYKYTNIEAGTHSYYCSNCKSGGFEDCIGGTATCGEKKMCEHCDTYYGETLAHDFSAEVADDEYFADYGTCQEHEVFYVSCENCGASSEGTEDEDTFVGEGYGDHEWDEGTLVGATCTEDGTLVFECTVDGCNEIKEEAAEGSAIGHDYTDTTKRDEEHLAKLGTCIEKTRYYKSCAECGANAKYDENKHLYVYETTILDHMFAEPEGGPVDITTLKSERTCTKRAVFYKICVNCGYDAKTLGFENETYEYGSLAEHNFVNKAEAEYLIAAATCAQSAIYAKSCDGKDCGLVAFENPNNLPITDPRLEIYIENEEIPANKTANAFRFGAALGHSPDKEGKNAVAYKDPDCTNKGSLGKCTCVRCDVVYAIYKNGDAELINDPASFDFSIPALGHDYKAELTKEYKAPTCKQYGQYGQVECNRCKANFYINEKNEIMSIDNVATFIFALEPLGHIDENGDELCDRATCGSFVTPEELCKCIACNGEGIMYFIGFILKWIWSLMGTNEYCECGAKHY